MLGLFSATILYCTIVLRSINDQIGADSVPHVAVTLGSVLSILCLFALLFYVHKIARSIIADTVVSRVASDLEAAITQAKGYSPNERKVQRTASKTDLRSVPTQEIALNKSGYVQTIDYERLTDLAQKHDALINIDIRAGQFILQGGCHVRIRSKGDLRSQDLEKVRRAFVVGHSRTSTQDLEYSIRQLVEVALRALSPGVNDPHTAITVINRLAAAMESATGLAHSSRHYDNMGQLRVTAPATDFSRLMDASFTEIRQSASGKPEVLTQMARIFRKLYPLLNKEAHKASLEKHLARLTRCAERSIDDPADLEDYFRALA